jgi:hypothetical protein
MKKSILIIALLSLSYCGMAQFNDTLFYKSGMAKVVEIYEFTPMITKFEKVNLKGDTLNSQVTANLISHFVMYDEEGILQYDSRMKDAEAESIRMQEKYPSSVSVSHHQLSINPFFLPFLSVNGKYNFRFGKQMQYSICSRVTYVSAMVEEFGGRGQYIVGAGFQFAPFYNDRFAFGIDFTPTIGFNGTGFENAILDDFNIMLPISLDFDVYFNERIGISADFGIGRVFENGASFVRPRGHIGLLIQFKDKKTFDTEYR